MHRSDIPLDQLTATAAEWKSSQQLKSEHRPIPRVERRDVDDPTNDDSMVDVLPDDPDMIVCACVCNSMWCMVHLVGVKTGLNG